MHVRSPAEHIHDLEGGRFLTFDAGWVHRVDQLDLGPLGGGLASQFEAVVEVALHLDDLRAVHHGLGEFAHCDLALGDEDRARDACAGCVRGGRGRGVPGGRAQHRGLPVVDGVAHGHRHPTVLERAGRVEALHLEVHLAPGDLGQVRCGDQRRATLEQGDHLPVVLDRQSVAVRLDQSRPCAVHGDRLTHWFPPVGERWTRSGRPPASPVPQRFRTMPHQVRDG